MYAVKYLHYVAFIKDKATRAEQHKLVFSKQNLVSTRSLFFEMHISPPLLLPDV